MASNRITRTMADNAANQMSEVRFGKKIESKKQQLMDFMKQLVERNLPAKVIQTFNENKQVYENRYHVTFYSESCASTYCNTNFQAPPVCRVNISNAEYAELCKMKRQIEDMRKDMVSFKNELSDALFMLRTEARLKQQFPQALPYFNFTGITTLSPSIEKLINIFEQK